MPITTVGVVSAVTPSVIETYFSHFLNRGPLRQKPTAHISYHEGLRLIRQFLEYSSKHTVEDLQSFTAQWVPTPHWVWSENVDITDDLLTRSANLIQNQLGPGGIELVGGRSWWQWRRPDTRLRAEWIEMKKDVAERKRTGEKLDRAILYVHGGAYYFGSVDEHRYQMQRHARKLKARVLAPRYRLAPQFPFPCGLQDCLAAYLFLLQLFDPSQILVAGDSAGGGMVLSMLVTLRDQGQPLPAGTILLSPWVDLTHSFPSISGEGIGDYIPPHGFHHKPSIYWPPPNGDELRNLNVQSAAKNKKSKKEDQSSASVEVNGSTGNNTNATPHPDLDMTIVIDGQKVEVKDQIQMYAVNRMLGHPLVSPVQQATLGGLPPMLIQVGGGELLRDEQIYLAHKAANPKEYPPGDNAVSEFGVNRDDVTKYPPTNVQLQVWEDLCHVPHTLSFTRPAKYMFRSVAQFGAWALAHAQQKDIEIDNDDAVSIISSGPDTDNEAAAASTTDLPRLSKKRTKTDGNEPVDIRLRKKPTGSVGKAGDPLPPFKDNMIRQRVDRHGVTYPLALPAELACLHLDPNSIGAIKAGPVRKWLAKKKEVDTKFASEKKKVQKKRLKEMSYGYEVIAEGERPPPTALAGRRRQDIPAEKRAKKSWGLAMWSGWGSSHDESTIERAEKMEYKAGRPDDASVAPSESERTRAPSVMSRTDWLSPDAGLKSTRRTSGASMFSRLERPRSSYQMVSDDGQADGDATPPAVPALQNKQRSFDRSSPRPSAQAVTPTEQSQAQEPQPESLPALPNVEAIKMSDIMPDSERIDGTENTFSSPTSSRPHNGTVAYPFKLRNPLKTASIATLDGDGISLAGSGTTRSTPVPSLAPVESMVAEKELVTPFAEKEVVAVLSSSQQHPHPTRPAESPFGAFTNQGQPGSFRSRASPADSRNGSNLDLISPTSPYTNNNNSSSASLPSSPADIHRPRDDSYRLRNPAFNQMGAANTMFGAANGSADPDRIQPVNMGPPKPVGFAYNPRDLRNAMLNRQAAESAAAKNGGHFPALQRQQTAPNMSSRQPAFMVDPVELPAIPQASAEAPSPIRSNAVSVNAEDSPVELSSVKQTRVSFLPPPRTNLPATPTIELSTSKQTRNSILPSPRSPRSPAQVESSTAAGGGGGGAAASTSSEGETPESPILRRSTGTVDSGSVASSATSAEQPIRENIIMPVVETRKPMPTQRLDASPSNAEQPPPTPPPKDQKFARPTNGVKTATEKSLFESPKKSLVNGNGDGSERPAKFGAESQLSALGE